MRSRRSFSARGLLANLVTAVAAVVVGAAAIESALGLVNRWGSREQPGHPFGEMSVFTRYHPVLGWDGVPNRRDRLLGQTVTQNSLGNRGPDVAIAKPRGTQRVVVLGDSQAWGLGVADDETIAARLEARLNAGVGQRWEALNLGVSGYGTDQAYLKYLLQGERYAPDAVVEVVFHNDVLENAATQAWRVEKPRFFFEGERLCLGNVPPPRAPGWPESALLSGDGARLWGWQIGLSWSQTYRFFQRRSWRFEPPPVPDPNDMALLRAELPCLGNRHEYAGDGEQIMLALLRALAVRTRSHRARLVTLFVPRPREMENRQRSSVYDAVQAELAGSGLVSIDLRRYAEAAGVGAETLFLAKNAHLSAAGSALAAQALAEALR